MNFQQYIQSLNIGDGVLIMHNQNAYIGVVDKITPTGLIKVTPNFNKFMVFTFDKYGKERGTNYNTSIVNKYDEKAMEKFRIIKAKYKMQINLNKTITFLEK